MALGTFPFIFRGLPASRFTLLFGDALPTNSYRSFDSRSKQRLWPRQICASVPVSSEPSHEVSHINFHDAIMWETQRTSGTPRDIQPPKLSDILQPVANQAILAMFSPMRETLGVLLACSMLRLFDSSWIQAPWTGDSILLHKTFHHSDNSDHLQPHLSCKLDVIAGDERTDSEVIAALGIIIMELDAGNAGALDEVEDVDLESGQPSFQVKLGRILYQWRERVRNVYRMISQACHDFESLVQAVDHPKLKPELKGAAVLYKCIFEPLKSQLLKEFYAKTQMFHGLSAPFGKLGSIGSITASQATKFVLFDDDEVPESDKR